MTGYRNEIARLERALGYRPSLVSPKSFNEKLLWKKIFDRDPLLPVVADKVRVREFVRQVLGEEAADKHLVPMLYLTTKPETIPFAKLPSEYIIKANHGSTTNLIVEAGEKVEPSRIITKCREWLGTSYGLRTHQWHYQKMDRKVLVEPLLRDDQGRIPQDYKLFFIHGEFVMMQVDADRFTSHSRRLFDAELNPLQVSYKKKRSETAPLPRNPSALVATGAGLANLFDFVRVDFYEIGTEHFIGELTIFPEGCAGRFDPMAFDFELGEKWTIRPGYWKERGKIG